MLKTEDGIEYADTGDDGMLDKALVLLQSLLLEKEKNKPKADSIRAMRMAGLPVKRS